jgi:hypothetical protein
LEGEIPSLSSSEKGQLKDGFASVSTDLEALELLRTNDRCKNSD